MHLTILGADKLVGLNYDINKGIPIFCNNEKIGEAITDKDNPNNIKLHLTEPLAFPFFKQEYLFPNDKVEGELKIGTEGRNIQPYIQITCKEMEGE